MVPVNNRCCCCSTEQKKTEYTERNENQKDTLRKEWSFNVNMWRCNGQEILCANLQNAPMLKVDAKRRKKREKRGSNKEEICVGKGMEKKFKKRNTETAIKWLRMKMNCSKIL